MDSIETALVAYLTAQDIGAPIVPGITAADKSPPLVICTAIREEPAEDGNNSLVTCRIEVKGLANDPETWKTLCNLTRSVLHLESEDLGAQVQQVGTNLIVWAGMPERTTEREISEEILVETYNVTFYCALAA